jgi:arylsulfatase A-like enzyme/Flp pilus assembly protein TadD
VWAVTGRLSFAPSTGYDCLGGRSLTIGHSRGRGFGTTRRAGVAAARLLAAAAIISGGAALPGCRASPERHPGAPVVLISVDTLRSDRLPAYGYRGVATPAIDRLRRDGVLFQSAWSPCPMTLPSHLTMLTGLQPPEHGVRSNAGYTFRGGASLPTLLRSHGYATGAAVTSFVLRAETGLGALFEAYDDAIDPRPGAVFADYQRAGGAAVASARRWTDEHRNRPFFYFLHLYEPHVPYEPPEPFRSRHGSGYDGEVAAADALVGEFLDHLRALGVYDRALVILTSDHGEGLGDHGEEQHSILLYREAIQVPLLVKLPGNRRAGGTVTAPAQLADIATTAAQILGYAWTGGEGPSLLELDHAPPRRLAAETLYPRLSLGWAELRSLVDGRWHYIHGPRPELFDLAADPAERQDLAASRPDVAEEMRRALLARPFAVPAPEAVSPETADRLAALGYVGRPRERDDAALPNPREALPHLARLRDGLRLAAEHRFEEAILVLRGLVAAQPRMSEAWVQLADVLLRAGRFADAAAAYDAALAHGPRSPDLLVARGTARLKARRLDDAEADARLAQPDLPGPALELLARVALARGAGPQALAHARSAVEAKRPAPPSALLALAEVQAGIGDLRGALASLDDAETGAAALGVPRPHGLDFRRGDALARLDRPQEAETAYRREIAAYPAHTQAYANLAVLLFLQRRAAEIDPLFERMTHASPALTAYRTAAVTWDALGDRRRAASWRARRPRGEASEPPRDATSGRQNLTPTEKR